MISAGWDPWMVAFFIFAAVTISMLGAGWAQWLEHQRRKQAMDVIKAAMEAGKEPPKIVYDQLQKAGAKPPWGEVVVFSALGFGFWLAFSQADGDSRTAFMVVAATMTVTALGCLALAIMRPGGGDKDDESE
jgi:ABC-type siderophore export system fused ATPase/permease subunit